MKFKLDCQDDLWDIRPIESGTILRDFYEQGVRILIIRGPFHYTAYVGVQENHPIAGFDYDLINLECHGGLTYSNKGEDEVRPMGFWWYGWDYGHSGDWVIYHEDNPILKNSSDKKWTLGEVIKEAKWVAYDFSKFMELSELIFNKNSEGNKVYYTKK